MEPRISFVTLGVADLARATQFYETVLRLPRIPMPPDADVAFFELGKTWLSLYPRDKLAADTGVPATDGGFCGFTLAHNVRRGADVGRLLDDIAAAGGHVIKPAQRTDWGGVSGYFADPDGFLWEVAWNPHFPHI